MLRQIVISTRRNAHQFLFSKGKAKGDIGASLRVVRQRISLVHVPAHEIGPEANVEQKGVGIVYPLLVKGGPHVVAGWNKVLDFHLFEFATAENEIAGRDFVAKGLANLGNAKGNLLPAGGENVFEIQKDSLCRFGAEVGGCGFVSHGADLGLEHEIEFAGHCESGFARRW